MLPANGVWRAVEDGLDGFFVSHVLQSGWM